MKKQNSVYLSGHLAEIEHRRVGLGDQTADAVFALVVTDHPAYGGHHRVVFLEDHAFEVLAFQALADGQPLEVTVEGWLRSANGCAAVMCDRVMFLNVTQGQRDQVARAKAESKAVSAGRKAQNAASGQK